MASNIAIVRDRIKAQGYCGLDDETSSKINYPLRFSPAICMMWVATGTILASPAVLWVLAPFAALGAVLPRHPFDALYNFGLRHLLDAPKLPPNGARRRFACALATTMIVAAAWSFQSGMFLTGRIVGWILVATAFVNVSTGFCVPSFILRIFFGSVVCRQEE